MARSLPSFRTRPYWLERTEMWIPALPCRAVGRTLVTLAAAVELACAALVADVADLDAAVLPHAPSARAAPKGARASSCPAPRARRRGGGAVTGDLRGALVVS